MPEFTAFRRKQAERGACEPHQYDPASIKTRGGARQIDDLNIQELAKFGADAGLIRFAGQRALIIDATAMGILRKERTHTSKLSNRLGTHEKSPADEPG